MIHTFVLLVGLAQTSDQDDAKTKSSSTADRKAVVARVCAVAKKAVEEEDLTRTDLVGNFGYTPFEEINKLGVVLVGFRLGLGKFLDKPVIHTIEPIYLSTKSEVYGVKRGKDRYSFGKKSKSNARETEILRAKPGYAVGGIKLQTGLQIDGMSLIYMRIDGDKLDLNDQYESKWVGSVGDRPKLLGGSGHLVIGLRGVEDKKDIKQLGFVYAGKDAPTNAEKTPGFRKGKNAADKNPADPKP
jgi:hypothetical protein